MHHVGRISSQRRLQVCEQEAPRTALLDPYCFVKSLFNPGGHYDCGPAPLLDATLKVLRVLGLAEE